MRRCKPCNSPISYLSLAVGFIRLNPGDAVFARPAGGNVDGTDDVLQVLVLGE